MSIYIKIYCSTLPLAFCATILTNWWNNFERKKTFNIVNKSFRGFTHVIMQPMPAGTFDFYEHFFAEMQHRPGTVIMNDLKTKFGTQAMLLTSFSS